MSWLAIRSLSFSVNMRILAWLNSQGHLPLNDPGIFDRCRICDTGLFFHEEKAT